MATIRIPETTHPAIAYGAHWSAPGESGYYIRPADEPDSPLVAAVCRRDIRWADGDEDSGPGVITVDDVLDALAEAAEAAERARYRRAENGWPD